MKRDQKGEEMNREGKIRKERKAKETREYEINWRGERKK